MYETFVALTSINPQHFIEWFSGSALSSIWTQTQVNTPASFAMSDTVDGGFRITADVGANNEGMINFNNKRQYAHDGAIFIGVMKDDSNTGITTYCGFANSLVGVDSDSPEIAQAYNTDINTNKGLRTADATTKSTTESDIPLDTAWTGYKIENGSANIKLTIDGVLKVTKTTNRPTVKLQPVCGVFGNAKSVNIRFIEVYNTDVAILSSIYERLFALTEIMKQRVVETFSGSVLNERWNETNITGTGSSGIVDAVDGGAFVKTGANSGDKTQIDFGNKRQYDETNCIMIAIAQRVDAACDQFVWLQGNNINDPADYAAYSDDSASTFKRLLTQGTGSGSATNTDVAVDTAITGIKIECSSADIKLSINGVLKITKTTNRPVLKLQPTMRVRSTSSGAKEIRSSYMEVFNKGTTPLVESVYELFNKLTTITKQHFWDWLSGSVISNRWTQVGSGGPTTAINDEVNGGVRLSTGGGATVNNVLGFNNKRPFDGANSDLIATCRRNTTTTDLQIGLKDNPVSESQSSFMQNSTANSFIRLTTNGGVSTTQTDTDVAPHTNWTSVKIENRSANVKLFLDGILKATSSTNLTTNKLQPFMAVFSISVATVKTGDFRFIEALNT